jgi:hypothetical protein
MYGIIVVKLTKSLMCVFVLLLSLSLFVVLSFGLLPIPSNQLTPHGLYLIVIALTRVFLFFHSHYYHSPSQTAACAHVRFVSLFLFLSLFSLILLLLLFSSSSSFYSFSSSSRSTQPSIDLLIHPSIHPSTHPSIHTYIDPYMDPSIHFFMEKNMLQHRVLKSKVMRKFLELLLRRLLLTA